MTGKISLPTSRLESGPCSAAEIERLPPWKFLMHSNNHSQHACKSGGCNRLGWSPFFWSVLLAIDGCPSYLSVFYDGLTRFILSIHRGSCYPWMHRRFFPQPWKLRRTTQSLVVFFTDWWVVLVRVWYLMATSIVFRIFWLRQSCWLVHGYIIWPWLAVSFGGCRHLRTQFLFLCHNVWSCDTIIVLEANLLVVIRSDLYVAIPCNQYLWQILWWWTIICLASIRLTFVNWFSLVHNKIWL